MLKTILLLADGTEISSGPGTVNAVRSLTLTQWVNDSQELTPGSVCAAMAELSLITPGGGLPIAAGEEFILYRADDTGRHRLGVFIAQKPTRPSANTMELTAYDRVSLLDKDLTDWLASLTGWPYRLYDFAALVCGACGLTLANEQIPNGDFAVEKFSGQGVTGRKLIRWVGQAAGRFCRANEQGELEFGWYTPRQGVSLGPSFQAGQELQIQRQGGSLVFSGPPLEAALTGQRLTLSTYLLEAVQDAGVLRLRTVPAGVRYYYYQGGLTFQDYTVAPIEGIHLRQSQQDVGTLYPDTPGGNILALTANPLLTTGNATRLVPVAETLYEQMKSVSYTPCRVRLPANTLIRPGDILPVYTPQGKPITLFVMKKTQSGQSETLECTGSPRRDSTFAVNNQSLQTLSGRVLELGLTVEGIRAENRDAAGKAAGLQLTVEGITAQVEHQQTQLEAARQELTRVEQDAKTVAITVSQLQQNGVSRVETSTGYTFGADGLHIRKTGEEMENRLDHTGMYVTRWGETILRANNQGVTAADVTVRNYLVVGEHARFEDYTTAADPNRTACFFV